MVLGLKVCSVQCAVCSVQCSVKCVVRSVTLSTLASPTNITNLSDYWNSLSCDAIREAGLANFFWPIVKCYIKYKEDFLCKIVKDFLYSRLKAVLKSFFIKSFTCRRCYEKMLKTRACFISVIEFKPIIKARVRKNAKRNDVFSNKQFFH